jgi:predicted nucleotide-binding protein
VGEFLKKYDGAALPKNEIAQNVLMTLGVPAERTADALTMIIDNAKSVGFLRQINDRTFVDLKGAAPTRDKATVADYASGAEEPVERTLPTSTDTGPAEIAADQTKSTRWKKVFITHGKNRALIEPIEKLLAFGDLEAVVSVRNQTAAQPVPSKIMEEMRSCGAAIIHVESERTLTDPEGNPQVVLNDNVLIEIGAAMALFGSRFILVVKDGVKLPSNLQGLLELRYKGATLDVNDTVALLDAIADMKKRSLP